MQISDAKHFQNSIKKFFDDWIPPPFLLHAEKWILVSWQSSRNMIVFRNSSCFWTNQNIGAGSRNILYILFSKLYKQMPINSKNILTLTGIIEIYIYIYKYPLLKRFIKELLIWSHAPYFCMKCNQFNDRYFSPAEE